eukprot:Phypoly_transcript_04073.p1 GENE.Phypoly_transcript_04073~~Phypoly_transcript_04073.p1  ORF type:complete len:401 (+),score=81.70 Phypoly_transcript_04073:88-1290(+)
MTCDDQSFFDSPELAQFRTLLFEGIHIATQMVTKPETPVEPEDPKKRRLGRVKHESRNSLRPGKAAEIEEPEEDKAASPPQPPANAIKDAAQTLLAHLLKFVHDFPSTLGPEVVSSQMDETDDHDPSVNGTAVFTTFGENMLITFMEVSNPDKSKPNLARILVRDPMGRFAWNLDIVYNNDNLPQKHLTTFSEKQPDVVIDNETYKYNAGSALTETTPKGVEKPAPGPDKLDELLASLGQHQECLPPQGTLRDPLAFTSLPKSTFIQSVDKISEFIKAEAEHLDSGSGNVKAQVAPLPAAGISPTHMCRMFMSHFGFLDVATTESRTALIDFNNKFERSLTQLDITAEREILKIGVIYVKPSQDDQKDILRNDSASPLYREFVDALGWPVDLKTHRGTSW